MKIKEWFKTTKDDFIMRWSEFFALCKYMYKDRVDLIMHLFIVGVFIWGFFTNVNMMAAAGFIGVYAFSATMRGAHWKRETEKLLQEFEDKFK